MVIAQLDLTNRPARCVDLAENYRRPVFGASWRSARRQVAASPDLNRRRLGIEVRFEQRGGVRAASCVYRAGLLDL